MPTAALPAPARPYLLCTSPYPDTLCPAHSSPPFLLSKRSRSSSPCHPRKIPRLTLTACHRPRSPPFCPPPLSSCSTTASCPPSPPPPHRLPELPDEVLVSILRFVDSASKLASLRTVSRQWSRVIDSTPYVWRRVSFKKANFAPRVVCTPTGRLALGDRPGHAAVSLAARSGNEWARFLKRTLFDRCTLRAVTAPQPVASLLVAGARTFESRPFPPWSGERPPQYDGAWVGVHAGRRALDLDSGVARADTAAAADVLRHVHEGGGESGTELGKLPRGAMVGLIHVSDAVRVQRGGNTTAWMWKIDRAVSLKRPIRCAGFVGLWGISGLLTDMLVDAMHSQ